jgi:hypothetical protein
MSWITSTSQSVRFCHSACSWPTASARPASVLRTHLRSLFAGASSEAVSSATGRMLRIHLNQET